MCSGPLLTISSPPPAHEGAWTGRVVNLWNSGEVRLGGRVKLVGFWVKICLVPFHFRSTTNLGVWWRVLSCGDSFVPDLFFIVVFLLSEFGRSGAVARDAFLRLASRRRRLVWLLFRDASTLIFSGHGSPVTLSRLILSRRLTVFELRFRHVLWMTVPEKTCSILMCHSVWSGLGGLRSSFQHPSTRVSLWWLRTARSRNSLGSCREASSVSAGFVLRMGVVSLCWVRVARLSGLSVCIQSVVGSLGFVP
ncbi:hypothetical protein YC2023_106187 [Brassica napus]